MLTKEIDVIRKVTIFLFWSFFLFLLSYYYYYIYICFIHNICISNFSDLFGFIPYDYSHDLISWSLLGTLFMSAIITVVFLIALEPCLMMIAVTVIYLISFRLFLMPITMTMIFFYHFGAIPYDCHYHIQQFL